MKTTIQSLIFLLAFTTQIAKAQRGSFDVSVSFNGSPRTLSCFVPTNYDSTHNYKLMVCLHGLGDNSANYRGALINSLGWASTFPNTIFICPDGGSDKNKDFYQPSGDEDVINTALRYGIDHYNIDTTKITLQGFSLGGRSALKYGLEHTSRFNALILNTPAFQGLDDLNNNPIASLIYPFQNADKIPVFLTVGSDDYLYNSVVNTLYTNLKKMDCPLNFIDVAAMGHSVPNNTYMSKANTYINYPFGSTNDIDLFALEGNNNQCSQTPTFNCWVRNNGDSIIHQINLNISAGVNKSTQSWTGNLMPNQHVVVPVSLQLTSGGHHTIDVVCVNNTDHNTSNNIASRVIELPSSSIGGIVSEGFENEFTGWNIQHNGSMFEWYKDEVAFKTGKASLGSFNTILLFYSNNNIQSFTSPFININSLPEKKLSFDIAFNYFKYTAPYFVNDTYFADTLEVEISTDCGSTYQSIYKKGGKELATVADPILNALTIQDCMFLPTSAEWRREVIDLSTYSATNNAIFKFNCISGMGGILNIDNIVAGSVLSGIKETGQNNNINIYPNPATSEFYIDTKENAMVKLFDANGKLVSSQDVSSSQKMVKTDLLSNGFYYIEIVTPTTTFKKQLLIQH